ncbi:MAG: anhydro-N-acetylmuramic acid kinase [Chthoniobacterales bacterium]|nr:anhydro-N-acetylmuramic acid kinase [Chthoniobacterales bacterium]
MANSQSDDKRLIAGAMSGTSADGVDIAITEIVGAGLAMQCRLVHHHPHPYPPALRAEIFAFRGGEASANLARLAQLGRDISLAYGAAVNEALRAAGLSAGDIRAIAAHGQTLYHAPPNTIQLFDPSLVAAEVGCAVISDFRRADLAAGGQGAPLVPFADYILFRHSTKNRVLLNLGGIANLTHIPAQATLEQVTAFDTGPASCISDYLCRKYDPNGPGYDQNGKAAARGKVIEAVVDRMLAFGYFQKPAPKSTDGPAMIQMFDSAVASTAKQHTPDDLRATACTITARSVARAMPKCDEIFVAGGGVYNHHLMSCIAEEGVQLRPQDKAGLPLDPLTKEAVAFALLGAATLDGFPSNIPSVTGAKRAVVLGSITPKP